MIFEKWGSVWNFEFFVDGKYAAGERGGFVDTLSLPREKGGMAFCVRQLAAFCLASGT